MINIVFKNLKRLFLQGWTFLICILSFSILVQNAHAEFRIGWKNQVDIANFAQFDKKHQKISRESIVWQNYNDDFKALHDLATNQVDIVPVDMIKFLSVVTVGLQGRIIAIDRQYGEESALVVKNQSHISNPQDLTGKIIAVPYMTSSYYSLLRYLEHYNIAPEKIHIVNMQLGEIKKAWQQNKIDGTYSEDIVEQPFVKDGNILVNSAQLAKWGYPTYQVWVVMDNTISDQPFWMQSFVEKVLENINYFKRDQPQLISHSEQIVQLSKLLNQSPEQVKETLKQQKYLDKTQQVLVMSRFLHKELEEIALFMKIQRIIPNMLPDYLIYVYDSFVKDAKCD